MIRSVVQDCNYLFFAFSSSEHSNINTAVHESAAILNDLKSEKLKVPAANFPKKNVRIYNLKFDQQIRLPVISAFV